MTKKSRRRRQPVQRGPRLAPFPIRLVFTALFVLLATGISLVLEQFTDDRILIFGISLIFLFLAFVFLYPRLNVWYLSWSEERAARRDTEPEPPVTPENGSGSAARRKERRL